MIKKQIEDIIYYQFENLLNFSNLHHAILSCHGGVSSGDFASLNLGNSTNDSYGNVESNFKKISQLFSIQALHKAYQTHSDEIWLLEDIYQNKPDSFDGLMTFQKKETLLTRHADCQIGLFYDPISHLIANVHCGWRGNVANIYEKTIRKMESLGSKVSNIYVGIGPSLGPNQSEFMNYKEYFPSYFESFQWKPNYFNLWELSRFQLENAGIKKEHLEIAQICSYTSSDFFSYRRKKESGRNATFIELL